MTTRETLVAARALIDSPDKWLQGWFGREGRYCAVGAIQRAMGVGVHVFVGYTPAYRCLMRAAGLGALPYGVAEWNDSHTHAEVLAAFDKAIAECDD